MSFYYVKNIERSDDMKLIVLKSSYNNVGRHNNKLINNRMNKCTILKEFIGLKNRVNGSIMEYFGGGG